MKRGWVKAPFTVSKFIQPWRLEEVIEWIDIHAAGEYKVFGLEFWFQRKKDLTAFLLRWA